MKHNLRLKKSQYSFFIPQEDSSYIVFNSATGVIISIHSEEKIRELKNIMDNSSFIYDNQNEMISVFYNKGILVEESKNEYEYVRFLYEKDVVRSNTLELILVVTRQCNLRCIYCYEQHENLAMTDEIYNRLLLFIKSVIDNKLYNNISIVLFGGEPFIEFDGVSKFLESAKLVCDENKVGFSCSATTNGALIYPERFETLAKLNCKYLQITVDGFADTHDKYRASLDKKGSWEKIINNLKYMASTKYNFRVTIRTNFNEEVFKRVEEFYKFIKDNFDERFSVYYEGIKKLGGSNDENLNILEGEAVSEKSINVGKLIKDLGLKNDVVDTMTQPFSRVCYASKHQNLIVDYDASILKCTLSLDDELNHIGYINEEGVMVIDQLKHSSWVGKKVDLKEECKTCKVLPICVGGRCVNGRVHGEEYICNPQEQEEELVRVISNYN